MKQDNITKLETVHTVTGRVTASYEYTYNEEGYITEEKVKETVVSQWFEEIYDLLLNTIFRDIDIDDYDEIKDAWKKFYDAHHTLCDHNDADGDGKYDNCYWDYLTATTTYSYRYDENWQLTSCTETIQGKVKTTYEYWYDADGNRTKYVKTFEGKTLECYTYKYNKANQLVSRTNERLQHDNVTTYSYDADGNLITEQTGHFEKTYEYDAENRLSVVKAQGTVLMAALYDGDGNRLFTMDYTGENTGDWDIWIPECGGNADTVDDNAKDAMKELASLVSSKDRDDYTITEYVNDITRENEEVLAELNPRGKITTAYTYGYTRESADSHGETQYYLYDGQNNVSRIASEWGRVKETYTYDPYGNLTYGIPDTVNYYGYNGESQNLATGLQYLRARYYNPHTGNFLTEDTYAGEITDPLSLNRYDYVSNNPVNYSDPSGHFAIPGWMKDGIDNMKKGVKDVVDTVKKGVNDVVDTVKNGVKSAVDTVKKAVKGVGETIKKSYKINQQNKELEQDMLEEFLLGDDEDKGGKNRKSGKDDTGDEPTNKPDMQDTAEDDADNALEQACKNVCDWVEENEAAIKITVGTAVIAGTGAATVITGGATAKNFLGSAIGGVAGGLLHMLFADEDEKTEGFADGYLLGAAAGAVSPSIASLVSSLKNASPLLSNPAVLASIEGFLETTVEEFVLLLEGEDINLASVGVDFLINCFTSGYNPQMNKLSEGMDKVAKKLGKWFEDTVEKGKKLIDDLTGNSGSGKKKTPEVKKETENQSSKQVLPYNLQFFANKGGSKINPLNGFSENQGYATFKELKKAIWTAGEGNHWHHIVEQSQIEKSGFSAQQIHNTSNIIAVDQATHAKITGYYNTKSFDFTGGLSVRDWLAGQSYEYQYEFGLNVLRQFGVIE